jgi:hypothetical protein
MAFFVLQILQANGTVPTAAPRTAATETQPIELP